jgi:type II secretory ATPase GspE/PulE/Tfp pilus assembly ATPase PilB-like protein
MILVTGPTGSGKTTTLYSFISELNLQSRNIMTIEDPVEYRVDGISQMQVKPTIGLTFAQGLRSILRQDPDVILVGEIRDQETAQIAVRAALTGHLVLATLHTTDAAGAITRLLDLQIEPYLISSALMTIISQRLVRKICVNCHSSGCADCFSSGYRGRTGLFELICMQEEERSLVEQRASSQAFRELMRKKGVLSLEEIGQKKVEEKVTTQEEIMRVIGMDQFWRNK